MSSGLIQSHLPPHYNSIGRVGENPTADRESRVVFSIGDVSELLVKE